MKTYYENGTVADLDYILSETDEFAIQCDIVENCDLLFYRNDLLVRKVNEELVNLCDTFRNLYFRDVNQYHKELYNLPNGLYIGGQSSSISISREEFLKLKDEFASLLPNMNKYIYVGDCHYLVDTVQNLVQSVEYCFVQYFVQISQIELSDRELNENTLYEVSSLKSFNLMFLVETFFTKMYSILDLMAKIIYELENPIMQFSSITKLKSAEKLWGDRKRISINNVTDSIFEDCIILKQIESLRNEAVHNGTWELNPKVFLELNNGKIAKRYMLFPDFEQGRLSAVKNRRHFFSSGTTINNALVKIHEDFYSRLLFTLKLINSKEYFSNILKKQVAL